MTILMIILVLPVNKKLQLIDFIWCLGRESNPHSLKDRGILSPLRLPIPPPRQARLCLDFNMSFKKRCQDFSRDAIKILSLKTPDAGGLVK